MRYAAARMTDHANERLDERNINPFAAKLCHTYGKKVSRDVRVLSIDDIPPGLLKSFKHSLKNRLEHQLPIACVMDDHEDGTYTVITAYRVQEGKRICKAPSRDTYMSRLSREPHSYRERHQ